MRWKMCPKCGVKLQTDEMEDELLIQKCPICKDVYMTLSGELLKKAEKVSEITGKTPEELIRDALLKMEDALSDKLESETS